MSKTLVTLFVLFLFNLQQADAHDVWLVQTQGDLLVAWGHGEKLDPYDPQKVKDTKAFDCMGGNTAVEVIKQEKRALLKAAGDTAVVTLYFDVGCWVKTEDGWKNISKRQAQGKFSVTESWKSLKYAKSILGPCDSFARPSGLPMEIVPEKDPFSIQPGGTLPIKVLKDGKPFEGADIRTGGKHQDDAHAQPKTDKDGRASVTISKAGPQLIVASFKRPLKDSTDADMLSVATSLTFRAK